MYIENTHTPMNRNDYEARARFERSVAFHNGLARIARIFKPRSTKR